MEGRKRVWAKLTNKFSDTSNFNRSPLCLNALQIRCARVSQGTRTFVCLFTTTTTKTTTKKSSRFSKDIHRPLFIRPLAASCRVLLIYFSPPTRSPFDAANVSSSKQFFENTFAALKVAPFHETKDGEKRGETAKCFSPNGNTVTRLPYVCVCVCVQAKFANARYVAARLHHQEKMEG